MQQSSATNKQNQMAWRQEKVLELAGNGYPEREIASQLQISDTTIQRFSLVKGTSKGTHSQRQTFFSWIAAGR
jgi:FixJ family two-component response regulator